MSARSDLCTMALVEVNNTDPKKYWAAVLHAYWRGPYPKHWCGAFAMWPLTQLLDVPFVWEVKGCYGANDSGFLHHLQKTDNPLPGDICYRDEPFQHHGIVLGLVPDSNLVKTVEGNYGNPSRVAINESFVRRWTAFYSIEALLSP